MADFPSDQDDLPSDSDDFPSGEDRLRDLEQHRRESRRAVEEAGGGESEGFELAEEELIEHTSHGDQHSTGLIMRDGASDDAPDKDDQLYGEADEELKAD
jgi:hypothetical protein